MHYYVDLTDAQEILIYSDVFKDKIPNLIDSIKKLNMHKAISIICELIRVRDSNLTIEKTVFGKIVFPFETVLKKDFCGIKPKSPKEMYSNPMLRKDKHIITIQMLLILLKKIIIHGNYASLHDTDYEISYDDYKTIIKLQLVVAEEVNDKHSIKTDENHLLYSTYHLNNKRNVANEFLRMYYMLEVIGRDKTNFDADVQNEYKDYYSEFTKKYHFTPTEYSSILFLQLQEYYSGINGLTYYSIWKDIKESYREGSVSQKACQIIGAISQTVSEYKEWAKQSENREWDFGKFFEYPFIDDGAGKFISVSDVTLRNAFFEKIFWLIRACYPRNDDEAMAFFGRLFEKYIQAITKEASKDDYVYINEFSFTSQGEQDKSSDAYVRKYSDLLVVEAKGFSVLLDCMTKNERVEDNKEKLFINPVLQADLCLSRTGNETKEFASVRHAYILSVTMDSINAVPDYYNSIHDVIIANKKSELTQYFFNFSIEEYELLMCLMERNQDVFGLLREYYDNARLKPFSAYIHERYSDIGMTSLMNKYYYEASHKMKSIMFEQIKES